MSGMLTWQYVGRDAMSTDVYSVLKESNFAAKNHMKIGLIGLLAVKSEETQ